MSYYHTARNRELLTSLIPVVCPPAPDGRAFAGDIVHHVALSMRSLGGVPRRALVAGMLGYDVGARVWPPSRGRTARELEPEAAAGYFGSWWRSPLGLQRNFARGIKGLIALAYWEQPAVKARIGYTPEAWFDRVKTRRLEVYSDDIERHARTVLAPDPLPSATDDG